MLILVLPLMAYAWDYREGNWNTDKCSRNFQSPVDIDTGDAIEIKKTSPDYLTLEKHFNKVKGQGKFTVHSFVVRSDSSFGTIKAVKKNGEVQYTGEIWGFHFHAPSEHHIDDDEYNLELQIVMKNPEQKYTNIIYSVFFSVQKISHSFFDLVINKENEIFDLGILFNSTKNSTSNDFYSYIGSITVPPCTENVLWLIDTDIKAISKKDLEFFTSKWAGDKNFAGGRGNNRAIQDRDNLKVTHYSKSFYLQGLAYLLLLLVSF